MLTSLRMALLEFMRCRKGLWYTVIDDTEWGLFDSLIAGADFGDAIYFYKPYNNNNDEHTQFGQSVLVISNPISSFPANQGY